MLVLAVYCVLDCATTPAERVLLLPKPVWLVLCILAPVVGGLSWLLLGRPRAVPATGTPGVPAEYDRPGRARAANPDDDAAFLEQLRKRAEEQRRRTAEDDGPEVDPQA